MLKKGVTVNRTNDDMVRYHASCSSSIGARRS